MATKPRSMLASVVGWIIVAVVLFWALGFVLGTIRFLIRAFAWVIVLAVLLALYFKLRESDG